MFIAVQLLNWVLTERPMNIDKFTGYYTQGVPEKMRHSDFLTSYISDPLKINCRPRFKA